MSDINYKEFMESIYRLLDKFDINDYRNYVLGVAKNTKTSERMDLIRTLESVEECEAEITETVMLQEESLISDIQELSERVDNLEYSYGYGFDRDYGGEREMGDGSWAEEVDEFFEGAQSKIRSKEYVVARKAYEMLFDILGGESLPCYESPSEMLKIDLGEQVGLYFRTIYMTAESECRAEELYEAILRLSYVISHEEINLKNMLGAESDILPQFDEFLKQWIKFLMDRNENFISSFVREAAILSGGIEGIKQFARENYERFPASYRDWVVELEKNNAETDEIIFAAREGLEKINRDYIVREEIAQTLVRQGYKIDDSEIIAEAMREAVYSRPSLKNIIDLMKFEKNKNNETNSVLDFAIKREEQLKVLKSDTYWGAEELRKVRFSKNLLNQLYLLSGKIEESYELCKDEKVISRGNDAGCEVLTVSFIFQLLSKNNLKHHFHMDNLWKSNIEKIKIEFYSTELAKFFVDEFNLSVKKVELVSSDITKYCEWCVELVSATVDYIISNQLRSEYDTGVLYLICCAEMLANMNFKERALELINAFRNKYPRHRNFISSLREADSRFH